MSDSNYTKQDLVDDLTLLENQLFKLKSMLSDAFDNAAKRKIEQLQKRNAELELENERLKEEIQTSKKAMGCVLSQWPS